MKSIEKELLEIADHIMNDKHTNIWHSIYDYTEKKILETKKQYSAGYLLFGAVIFLMLFGSFFLSINRERRIVSLKYQIRQKDSLNTKNLILLDSLQNKVCPASLNDKNR